MCDDLSECVIWSTGAYFTITNETLLKGLACQYHMDWDADGISERNVARKYIEPLTTKQRDLLRSQMLVFLTELEDQKLNSNWLEMGAHGWLVETHTRKYLEAVLLQL